MIYEFEGIVPVVHASSFVHPQACVSGNVIIGKNVYVGPGAAIRGDWGEIIIEDGCNIQESCTIHMFPGTTVLLEYAAHIGHGAVIHGAKIGTQCLIGINSVVMDGCEIGPECIVGALTFVKGDSKIPARSMVVGNPGRIIGEVSDKMIDWKRKGTALYQKLPARLHETLKACDPLHEITAKRVQSQSVYRPWSESKD